jgi:hypothetical protein
MRENNDLEDIKDVIENDISLSFLDNFVNEARKNGAIE